MNDSNEFWFEHAGVRLYVRELGSGAPLVFLHGGFADHRASLLRVGALAAQARVIAPDLRGSGRSVYRGELSWDLLADDVRALLDALGLERAVIGGTSAGSAVALRFALRHPERTRGALLMAPIYPGTALGLSEAQRAAMDAMHEAGSRTVREGMDALRPLFERLPDAIRARALEMTRSFDPGSVAATTGFLASGAQPFDELTELGAIDAPVLIVPGTDLEHPAELAALYAQHLPRSVLVAADAVDLVQRMAELVRG
ncbi:MAG TPA: alpha/beta hydrolase [Polyangiales bacterium]|nr:alpha/beta hydrolase [Polyangiales bacterium]